MSAAANTTPARATRPRSASRATATIVALVLGILGLGIGGAGGVLLALGDGTLRSDAHSLTTQASAFATSVADVSDLDDLSGLIGRPSVDVDARGDGLFVGVGRAQDVESYLAGAPVEEITDLELDPFRLDRETHDGTRALSPPAAQDFWVASGAGSLRWDVRDGDYRVVLMNADGRRGVDASVRIGMTVPHLRAIAWMLVGIGASVLLAGLIAAVAALRRRDLH